MPPSPSVTVAGTKTHPAIDEARLLAISFNDPPILSSGARYRRDSLGVVMPQPADRSASASSTLCDHSVGDCPPAHTATSPFPVSQPLRETASPVLFNMQTQSWRDRLQSTWSHSMGPVLVLVSQFFGVAMNVTTRILEIEGNDGNGYHPFQILFARMSATLVLSSCYVWWGRIDHAPFGPREVRWLLILRGFAGFFGVYGMYYSLLYLPLSDATVITFLAPSLTCFACSILIKEPFTRMEQIAALISLFGVILIARPTSLFASTLPSKSQPSAPDATSDSGDYTDVTPSQRALAVAVALLGVLGAATAYTALRWIGQRAHALISVNYFALWCTIVSAAAMAFGPPSIPFLLPTAPRDLALLGLLGLSGFVMQLLMAAGLQREKSSRATNMIYCQMLFALVGDKMVFGTSPDAWGWAGSSLILGSAIYVAVRKDQGKQAKRRSGRADEERGRAEVFDGRGEGEGDVGEELVERREGSHATDGSGGSNHISHC